jgi:predicted ATP-dependent serine protease
VTSRAELFLGIIAVATLATAVVQIGVLVAAGLMFRRIQKLMDRIESELKPIVDSVQQIARDASKATTLAVAQVERVDRAMADLTQRLEKVLAVVQTVVSGPLAEGAAWLGGVRAVLNLVRQFRSARRRSRADEDDALFI